jgi:hypothetical protein
VCGAHAVGAAGHICARLHGHNRGDLGLAQRAPDPRHPKHGHANDFAHKPSNTLFYELCTSPKKATHTHVQVTHTLACARTHGERVGRTHKRPLSAAVCVKTATSPLVISWLEVVGVAVKAAARFVKKPTKRDTEKLSGSWRHRQTSFCRLQI